MSLLGLLLLPFVGSIVTLVLPTRARTLLAGVAGGVAVAATACTIRLFPSVRDGGVLRERVEWLPQLGFDLVLRVDGFAWLFALLVSGIGALVCLYARYYMSPRDPVARFYAMFLAFMGSILGLVMSGNLLQLALFWEMTSLASFMLIGYWHHRVDAQRGARMALIVTGAGGLCLLGAMVLLGQVVGSHEVDQVLASGAVVRAHPWYPAILALLLLGAFTKSAQFPFHFWLPRAMAAPTPVSAYLHSATMVKAGVFLLARFWPVFAGTDAWFWWVGGTGAVTLVVGAYLAMFQDDLKGLLAYSTISHLGLIVLLLGLGSPLAAVAAVFHTMNHATFKASLFMAAGIVDHETGTRDLRRLSGLVRVMPRTAVLALVATAAMAGVPLLNGFLSKEMFFAETIGASTRHGADWALPLLATLAALFAVVYSLRFGIGTFFGPPPTDLPRQPAEPPLWMRVPVMLLVIACIAVGVAPAPVVGPVLAAAALPVVGGSLPAYNLAVWHGFGAPLLMSALAIAGGAAAWWLMRRQMGAARWRGAPRRPVGRDLFEAGILALTRAARILTQRLVPRGLQAQLLAIALVTMVLAAMASGWQLPGAGSRPRLPPSQMYALVWIMGSLCALGAAAAAKYHRLVAVALVGGVGLATSLTFAWFSAPDLALTQIAVDIVSTALFLLALRWLPKRSAALAPPTRWRSRARRGRDLVLAVAAGAGLAALSFAFLTRPTPPSIASFHLANALPGGGGRNVVNVILVDFRALDTLGEITVLGAVALAVFALLRRFRPPVESVARPLQQRIAKAAPQSDLIRVQRDDPLPGGYLLVPAVVARLLLPLGLMLAAWLLLRGHDAPGGGFVAGLVVAIVLLLQYVVAGTRWVEARAHLQPPRLIGLGLLLALAAGLGALALGYPLLTSHTATVTLPLLGVLHLPSAALFDVGVMATVVGATLLILTALAHQSVRSHQPAMPGIGGPD